MKKIVSMILVVMMTLVCFATVGSAATFTAAQVDAIQQMYLAADEEAADVAVSAEVVEGDIVVTYSSDALKAITDGQATIIIFNATTNAKPSAGNMIQIDQFAYDAEVDTYSYAYATEAGQTIVVMMGGTDLDTPGSATITIEDDGVMGDLDGDEEATMLDAVLLASWTVGNVDLSDAQLKLADFNGDGEVTLLDAVAIVQSTVA